MTDERPRRDITIAAPDELTALRQRIAELESSAANRFAMFQSAQNEITGLKAERDALRDGILALADEMLHNVESHNVGAQLPPYAKGRRDSYADAERRIRSLLADHSGEGNTDATK